MADFEKMDGATVKDLTRLAELAEDADFAEQAFSLANQNGGIEKLPAILKQARAGILKKARAERVQILRKKAERRQRVHELIVLGAVAEKLIGSRDPDALKRHFAGEGISEP